MTNSIKFQRFKQTRNKGKSQTTQNRIDECSLARSLLWRSHVIPPPRHVQTRGSARVSCFGGDQVDGRLHASGLGVRGLQAPAGA